MSFDSRRDHLKNKKPLVVCLKAFSLDGVMKIPAIG